MDPLLQGKGTSVPHKGGVTSLVVSKNLFLSGGKDGVIIKWTSSTFDTKMCSFKVPDTCSPHIKALDATPDGGRVIVGTRSSEIFELGVKAWVSDSTPPSVKAFVKGHFAFELWGLAIHPDDRKFASVGDDKTLREWNMKTFEQITMVKLPGIARAVAYSNGKVKGKYLVVGLGGRIGRGKEVGGGTIVVVDAQKKAIVATTETPGKQWITDIKFAPKGHRVALCSHDKKIYIYDWDESVFDTEDKKGAAPQPLTLKLTLKGHNSYVSHIDWSTDEKFLQSTSGDYELLF